MHRVEIRCGMQLPKAEMVGKLELLPQQSSPRHHSSCQQLSKPHEQLSLAKWYWNVLCIALTEYS